MVAATSPQSHGSLYRTTSCSEKKHASENTPHLHNSPKHFSGGSTRFV